MSCAQTAEPLKMQFRMLSRVGPGNMYHMGKYIPHGRSTFGVSWQLKSIVKHRIWWVGLNRPFAARMPAIQPFCQITLTTCLIIDTQL